MTKLDDIMWKLNLTNKKLAKLSGVSPTTINLIRTGNGKGYRSTIRKIANALGVNANQIGD
ncbi:XRE family transcriptional regulator [Streptococcus sp. UMB1385]|jgi:DNA-binding helix-turn-helix protein|nr:XRE family transcriptional regulator [Streptococcus sp. UMB1385]DAP17682.1 MAG TPA: Regulatory protein [Caudoviricetes sp.]DAU51827.1 MAG TPA: Regulatory protein [Caudoviricetes sp.]DAY44349.1 MAG TPA: Regulatory protein [Caudoviricetes sp.]